MKLSGGVSYENITDWIFEGFGAVLFQQKTALVTSILELLSAPTYLFVNGSTQLRLGRGICDLPS